MGKKHGKGKKKTIVVSLAEFNEDAGLGGVDPSLADLPSAPKALEEWEAQGGRPEYNSRGYKQKGPARERTYDNDGDGEDHDWVRRGPIDDQKKGNGFGAGMSGGDRDWGGARRGPIDEETGERKERDWKDMRRGPVESAFEGRQQGGEPDWGKRRGPIEAEPAKERRVIRDDSWGSARKQTVEAEFKSESDEGDKDWTNRKGPIEPIAPRAEVDWTSRKGPLESKFAQERKEPDWSSRKGPVEANLVDPKRHESDWSFRRGPILETESQNKHRPRAAEPDWSARRGPVDVESSANQKPVRDVDFGHMRRGAKLQEMEQSSSSAHFSRRAGSEKDSWRRYPVRERPASTGQEGDRPSRDWGAARRSQPLVERPTRMNNGRMSHGIDSSAVTQETDVGEKQEEADDWTTVRSGAQKRQAALANRRSFGRDYTRGFGRRNFRDSRGSSQMRGPIEDTKESTNATLTNVTQTTATAAP